MYKSNPILLDKSVFANEDISKPENRINLSLFGLFLIDEFRKWFLGKLKLPLDSAIFPSCNLFGGVRPDYAIYDTNNNPIAFIEVEIGMEDTGQILNFRNLIIEPVFSICGKKQFQCDLSLEEIYIFLRNLKFDSLQQRKNFAVFETLYYENVLCYGSERYKPTTISDEMRETEIVKALLEHFQLDEDIGKPLDPGDIRIQTLKKKWILT
jgi:hypothetical protein